MKKQILSELFKTTEITEQNNHLIYKNNKYLVYDHVEAHKVNYFQGPFSKYKCVGQIRENSYIKYYIYKLNDSN